VDDDESVADSGDEIDIDVEDDTASPVTSDAESNGGVCSSSIDEETGKPSLGLLQPATKMAASAKKSGGFSIDDIMRR
jgi:hypothetical protein